MSKFIEAAERVIILARKIRDYYAMELPKRHPHYPEIRLNEEDPPAPPEQAELGDLLRALPPDMVYRLITLMHLGRDDFEPDDFSDQVDDFRKLSRNPDLAISQMMDKAPLGDYIQDGLDKLRYRNIPIEPLLEKQSKMSRVSPQ